MICSDCGREIPYYEESYEDGHGGRFCQTCDTKYGTCDVCEKPTLSDEMYFRSCSPELFLGRQEEIECLCPVCVKIW